LCHAKNSLARPIAKERQQQQDKCLVGEGVQLLKTINLIGDWTMGKVKLYARCI
jgi:hypothetical protein